MKIDRITATFQCFMDVTRLRMVRLLVSLDANDAEEVCVSHFVLSLGEPQYNISKQLKILELAGVLVSRKIGRNVYFRLEEGALVEGLFALVAELPDSERLFAKDAKKLANLLSSEVKQKGAKVLKTPAAKKKGRKSVVVAEARDRNEMELPSNLL